jgi:hypothetical protein
MKKPLFVVATTILTLLASFIPVSLANAADPVCTINVTESNTTVQGTNLGDVICITGDNNIVNALGGDDTVIDDGNDNTINLGEGFDIYDGSGGDGSTVDGGPGNDEITGTPGEDELTGGDGDDTLIGGEEDDTLNGGLGADQLAGNAGNDLLQGNSGDDSLFGGHGNDKLSGDDGTNTVDGGAGYNVCVASTDVTIGCSVFVTIELKFVYTVSGSLLDWDGFPVSNFRFTLGSAEAKTDASGNFIVSVPAGEHLLRFGTDRAQTSGFPEWWFFEASLNVTKDLELNLRLPKPTKTLLNVQDGDGNPIAGALVRHKGWGSTVGLTYDLGSGLQARGSSRVSSIMGAPDDTDVNGNTYLYSYGMGYEVDISFRLGDTTITETRKIIAKSSAPRSFKAESLTGYSFNLCWDKPWDNGGSAITSYLTEWSRDNGLTWSKLSSAVTDGCKIKASGAVPATSYLLRLSALNAAGTSDFATL